MGKYAVKSPQRTRQPQTLKHGMFFLKKKKKKQMWAWLVGAAVAVVVHFHNQSGLYEHCVFKLTTEEPS